MSKRLFVGIAAAGLLVAGQALAHAKLEKATPGDGASLDHAPQALELEFTEGVILTAVTVSNDGEDVPLEGELNGKASESFSVPLPGLEPGSYAVMWRALSEEDGHPMKGSLSFTVAE